MKPLPSLKPKKRYIVFEYEAQDSISVSDLKEAVNQALVRFLGEFGVAKASPQFMPRYAKGNKFTLKVAHTGVDEVKAALILITNIKKVKCKMKSIATSGTLKKAGSYL